MKLLLFLLSLLLVPANADAREIVRNMNRWRGYAPFADAAGMVKGNHAVPLRGNAATLTARFEQRKPGDAVIYLSDRSGRRITLGQTLSDSEDAFGAEQEKVAPLIIAKDCSCDPSTIITGKPRTNPRNLSLTLSLTSDSLRFLSATESGSIETLMPLPFLPDSIGIGNAGKGILRLSEAGLNMTAAENVAATINSDTLNAHFQRSSDPIEGYWALLDRDLDESRMRLGGDYTLAIVSDAAGGYRIVYINGARINPRLWMPGDIKGSLMPSQIKGVFGCEWLDAGRRSISHDVVAQPDPDNPGIIILQFPYQRSSLRLRKLGKTLFAAEQ